MKTLFEIPTRLALLVASATVAFTPLIGSETDNSWSTLINAQQLKQMIDQPEVVVIDVRKPEEYAAGHIPGAVAVPVGVWRTPSAKTGPSQEIFTKEDGSPDVAKYEELLGSYGISNDKHIVVYGSHAGKNDGTTPAAILSWLGHERLSYLDGLGIEEWKKAGFEVSTEARELPQTTYKANAQTEWVWNLEKVLANINAENVVFLDVRTPEEFSGKDLRGNKHGGHIPKAVNMDYETMLQADKLVVSKADAKKMFEEAGVTPDKTVVLYCQTATRTSLAQLALKDLGYDKVALYDASWQEYGNRDDTPIEVPQQ